jgi:hypothetical protein
MIVPTERPNIDKNLSFDDLISNAEYSKIAITFPSGESDTCHGGPIHFNLLISPFKSITLKRSQKNLPFD